MGAVTNFTSETRAPVDCFDYAYAAEQEYCGGTQCSYQFFAAKYDECTNQQ